MCKEQVEFVSTRTMSRMLGFNEGWLKSNIGVLFFEDLHTIRLGHRTRRWCVPLCIDRIANINNEASHREAMEIYWAKQPCNWEKPRNFAKRKKEVKQYIDAIFRKSNHRD